MKISNLGTITSSNVGTTSNIGAGKQPQFTLM